MMLSFEFFEENTRRLTCNKTLFLSVVATLYSKQLRQMQSLCDLTVACLSFL